ncbi:hypothetical protein [Nocardia crassostreae]|uniref:hypothetical protein n=1 Tax=Nocardia crassostreae TaxID=53428 RepID=UPI00082A9761|nr:hypothetical protein [Nocardia crassostreae]
MSDAPTAQDLLDITSSATLRARRAAFMPGWVPPAAGVLGGGAVALVGLGNADDGSGFLCSGYGVFAIFLVMMAWVWRTQRSRGVIPRSPADEPTRRWQRFLLYVLPPLAACMLIDFAHGWLNILFGVIVGGIPWFGFARQRARACPN